MIKFKFNKEKTIAVMLFIVKHLGSADLHKISKILYYADQNTWLNTGLQLQGIFTTR